MDNTLGLALLGSAFILLVIFVLIVRYLVNNRPDSKLGRIAEVIDDVIERIPD